MRYLCYLSISDKLFVAPIRIIKFLHCKDDTEFYLYIFTVYFTITCYNLAFCEDGATLKLFMFWVCFLHFFLCFFPSIVVGMLGVCFSFYLFFLILLIFNYDCNWLCPLCSFSNATLFLMPIRKKKATHLKSNL